MSLKDFQSKDATIAEGWHVFNSGNAMEEDPDAHLRPHAKKNNEIGDISDLLSYAGQLRTNLAKPNVLNPYDALSAGLNLQSSIHTLLHPPVSKKDTDIYEELWIDPVTKDTVTSSEADRRQIKRFGQLDNTGFIGTFETRKVNK